MPFVELETNVPPAQLPRDLPARLSAAAAAILGKPEEVRGAGEGGCGEGRGGEGRPPPLRPRLTRPLPRSEWRRR